MGDAGGVDGAQPRREPVGEPTELLGVERAVLADVVLEGGPVDELGDDEGGDAVDLRVQHPGHPLAADAVEELDLPAQPLTSGGIRGDRLVEDLDGHPVAVGVERLVHRAHPAGADAPDEVVAVDPLHDDNLPSPSVGTVVPMPLAAAPGSLGKRIPKED